MERLGGKEEVRAAVAEARREGRSIGFVPTMGALHEGHLSLVRAASSRTDLVVASVFVNPTQFGPSEDFEAYPRDIDADMRMLSAEGVDIVFTPTPDIMYGDGPKVTVDPGELAMRWEGEVRPTHFVGVATVVTKLLNIVRPDLAFFGEKDFQQLQIVKRMVLDLDGGVGIVGCPIVREADGLALSSRNAYLSAQERALAVVVPDALNAAVEAACWGERDPRSLEAIVREKIAARQGVELDYAAVVDPITLEPADDLDSPKRAIVAVRVGSTRLIDNCELKAADA
ncbi:MAG TPA: pantoate--beta-alanine ligase [Coriobacteriia bacterium]|nr:pantoate--beta-alanine ligase [Coriobacteriia bacterium]